MTIRITNAFLHKYVLKAALPFILRDRFTIDGEAHDGAVSLSFDCERDEDMQRIPSLLQLLRETRIQTSFALIGNLVQKHPNSAKDIIKDGHEIVNHSHSHPQNFRSVSPDEMRKEVVSFQDLMIRNYGYRPQGFRAPHLMREYNEALFRILRENRLYDTSYLGHGISMIDGVVEIPLTTCPDHPKLCFDFSHNFQLPFISCGTEQFFRLWERLVRTGDFISIYFDPQLISDDFLRGIIQRVPDNYQFCRLEDAAKLMNRSVENRRNNE